MQNRHGNGSGCLKIKGKKALGGGPFLFPGQAILLPPFCQSRLRLTAARFVRRSARGVGAVQRIRRPGGGGTQCPVRPALCKGSPPCAAGFRILPAEQGGEPYNGTLSLLAQIKKNPSRLKQRLGHRISYSVVGEPNRRYLYLCYNQRGSLPPAVRSATPLNLQIYVF